MSAPQGFAPGVCPACGGLTLFIEDDGTITCCFRNCPDPYAADEAIRVNGGCCNDPDETCPNCPELTKES